MAGNLEKKKARSPLQSLYQKKSQLDQRFTGKKWHHKNTRRKHTKIFQTSKYERSF